MRILKKLFGGEFERTKDKGDYIEITRIRDGFIRLDVDKIKIHKSELHLLDGKPMKKIN